MDIYLNKVLDDRYEIIEIIGTGGMAIVYKALDKKLGRPVAVKILKNDLRSDKELRNRFHAESEAVARLNHPNIINVFDVSTNDDIDYFVMELIDGITLKQYINHRKTLSIKEALHFTVQILKGLEHAHSKMIVHRDIKPQNIMILRDGAVKVTDFGIARIAGASRDYTTNHENAYGSVHYIAPEQARCEETDGRADIYAVGVILYEMLTGSLPYEGDNVVSIAMQHINSSPVPPRELNPEIPETLEDITLGALCGDLSKRYANAEEMIEDIEGFRQSPSAFVPRASAFRTGASDTVRFFPSDTMPPQIVRNPAVKNTPDTETADIVPVGGKKVNIMPVLAALIALMVLIATAVALWITIISPGSETKDVKVPNLVGRTYADVQADKTLDFELVIVGDRFDNLYEAGVIVQQNQNVGRTVKSGSTIELVLSLGKRTAKMPNYMNQLYTDANNDMKMLMHDGVTVTYLFETSKTVTRNHIIRTNPVEGQTIIAGQTITFYISSGHEEDVVAIPKLIGESELRARSLLIDSGLSIGSVTYETNDSYPSGTVINYSPSAEFVPKGTEVSLTVSRQSTTVTETEPVTEEPPEPISLDWTLMLPQGEEFPESYLVEIYHKGAIIYSGTHEKTENEITLNVEGEGTVEMEIFIDSVLWKTEDLLFS